MIRTLPNMPCSVQAGVTAYCRGKNASDEDVKLLHELLLTTGKSFGIYKLYHNFIFSLYCVGGIVLLW